jgi:WXG100 family type VII secretion target
MAQTAAKFDGVSQSLDSMLTRLMGELEVLQTAWVGEGGKAFTTVKLQWQKDQTAIQQALTQTAEAIRTSGQQYTASDTDAAGRVNATNRGVQLPL